MKKNLPISQPKSRQFGSVYSISKQDYQTLKSLCNHDKFNPQKQDMQTTRKNPTNQNLIISFQSTSLVNILVFKYLIFFRDPKNDYFTQLVETQINKQSNQEIKRKINHSLTIFKSVICKNLQFFLKSKDKLSNPRQQQSIQPLRKSINYNFPTIKVNNSIIISLIQFLQSSSVRHNLENIIFDWINQSSGKIFSVFNQNLTQCLKNHKISQTPSYLVQFGKMSEQISVLLTGKNISSLDENLKSFMSNRKSQNIQKIQGFKLILFPNRNALANFVQKLKAKLIQQIPFQRQMSFSGEQNLTFRSCYISDTTDGNEEQNDDKILDLKQKPTLDLSSKLMTNEKNKKVEGKQKIVQRSKFSIFENLISLLLLLGILGVVVFYNCQPQNPFSIRCFEFKQELSDLVSFVVFQILERFFLFNLKLIYTHDWSLNSLVNQ